MTLIPSGTVSNGNSGNNYSYAFVNNTTGVIIPQGITVTSTTGGKQYDQTTSSAGIPTVTVGSLGSDIGTFTQVYDSASVGIGTKTLTPSGTISNGNGGNNYVITFATAPGAITKRVLSITINSQVKCSGTAFTFTGTEYVVGSGGLLSVDTVTGVILTSVASSAFGVGPRSYPIKGLNAISNNISNYVINFTLGTFLVNFCPATQVVPSQCVATKGVSDFICASEVATSTCYRFEVVRGATTNFVETICTYFQPIEIGGFATSATYTIRVAALINGLWGNYVTPCTVSTPIAKIIDAQAVTTIFEVKAYPNPFASKFSLDIQSSSDQVIEMMAFDMLGRQLEEQNASVSELTTREIGSNYPSGVYNIIVSQGEEVKSIRMIKR